jgi:hypothetical protein
MIPKLDYERLSAELATLEDVLAGIPLTDYLARIGLEARREEVRESLARLGQRPDRQARVALFFGGDPVIGSEGVKARFASDAVGSFQDILTNVWGTSQGGTVATVGPVRDQDVSQLHITRLLQGSFGFLLEEMDARGEPLFDSPLKGAANHAAEVIGAFADEDDRRFSAVIADLSPRVFASVRKFLRYVHSDRATFRLVEGDTDIRVDHFGVERAWERAEHSRVDEERVSMTGRLLGVVPLRRRFEFEPDNGTVIYGKVGDEFSHSYLERINTEQFAGKRWRALIHKKLVERAGIPPVEDYTLLRLDDPDAVANAAPIEILPES